MKNSKLKRIRATLKVGKGPYRSDQFWLIDSLDQAVEFVEGSLATCGRLAAYKGEPCPHCDRARLWLARVKGGEDGSDRKEQEAH